MSQGRSAPFAVSECRRIESSAGPAMGGEGMPENADSVFRHFYTQKQERTKNARRITQRLWELSPHTDTGQEKEDQYA